jgi:hypothetical protein
MMASRERTAARMFASGPAAEIQRLSCRGFLRLKGFTGTGLAQPKGGAFIKTRRSGSRTVPKGSIWAIGLRVTRPMLRAVSSPNFEAAQPCAASWMVMAKRRTNRLITSVMMFISNQTYL